MILIDNIHICKSHKVCIFSVHCATVECSCGECENTGLFYIMKFLMFYSFVLSMNYCQIIIQLRIVPVWNNWRCVGSISE